MASEPATRDLMFQDEIKETVRQAYAAIETGGGETVARRLYSEQELAEVPPDAIEWALGVGNPVRYALLQPGETVLDIGSGGGIDTILAAHRVGSEERQSGSTSSSRCSNVLEAMRPRWASMAGLSSSRERWRTSRCRTGPWTL